MQKFYFTNWDVGLKTKMGRSQEVRIPSRRVYILLQLKSFPCHTHAVEMGIKLVA